MADIDPVASVAEARRAAAAEMLRRLVAHAAARTTDRAAAALPLPATAYTDPARFAAETEVLFRRLPLVAGLSRDLAVGDTLLFEAAGPSILVTRARDGKPRAFRNLCTHRGAKLVTGEEATCVHRARLTCPFHAWTFDLEGRLVAQPGKAGFADHAQGARNLLPVAAEERHGLIFVQPEGAMDLDAHLGSMGEVLRLMELDAAEPVKRGRIPGDANWKYALDTYGEGYHFASLHPNNIGITHLSDVAVFDAHGLHHRIAFPTKAMAELASTPPESWPETDYNGVHFLFPNTVIFMGSVEPGKTFVQLFRLFPRGVDALVCEFAVYAPGGVRDQSHRTEVEAAFDITETVVRTEDYAQAAQSCANLRTAPSGFQVVLGANEVALQRLHLNIAEVTGVPIA
jgi:phenylpropionate dioxygenase-like ring-hydroxylating dioxygenase large terminal subunit